MSCLVHLLLWLTVTHASRAFQPKAALSSLQVLGVCLLSVNTNLSASSLGLTTHFDSDIISTSNYVSNERAFFVCLYAQQGLLAAKG